MTIRQSIVDAIETRLKLIASGYQFTLDSGVYTCETTIKEVYPWRKVPFSVAQTPCLAFWDTSDEISPATNVDQEHKLAITVVGYLSGSSSIDAARALMADVFAAIESDKSWGGLARYTDITEATPDVSQAGDVIAGIQINVAVTYRTPYGRL